jgi:hypothetical protein
MPGKITAGTTREKKIDEPRTSIIGARAKSVKGVNKYRKIDKRGRIQG